MEKNTYKISELNAVLNLISKCQNDKDLKNPSTVLFGIRIFKKIELILKNYSEEQKEIFKKFDVIESQVEGQASFDWSENPNKDIITASINELMNTEHHVEGFNKVDEEDFIIYTRGLDNQSIIFLYDYLVKND
tara:strand:+ start:41 stop:442 length:402 start_codon:yes stop_codon:yes gene_type:complete